MVVKVVDKAELVDLLEPLIRRVVREELAHLVMQTPGTFYLDADSPLYADLEQILERKAQGNVKLYSHEEMWRE